MGSMSSLPIYKNIGREDDPDPVTGLTSRERYLLKSTVAIFKKNTVEVAVTIMDTYLERHPEAKQIFPFRDVPDEQLHNDVGYRAHSTRSMYGFFAIIDAIDKPDLLCALLGKLGKSHAPRAVNEKIFWQFMDSLIVVFSAYNLKNEEVRAWTKALKIIFETINITIKETQAELGDDADKNESDNKSLIMV